MRRRCWAVVPLKPPARAKTRLRGLVADGRHERLVLALALDTVAAAVACPAVAGVLVVTADPVAAAAVADIGARVAPEPPGGGLNPAVRAGAERLRRDPAVAADWLLALAGDLPALRPAELAAAFAAAVAGARPAFVADAAGTGTTMLAVPPGSPMRPRFGPNSAAAHAAAGAVRLSAGPSLSRDVDTAADLAAAAELGLGPRTVAACRCARVST